MALLAGPLSTVAGVASAAQAVAHAPALLLARDASPGLDPRGWLVSEKLDGIRAYWPGRRDGADAVLRFRGGGAVPAPADFLAALPDDAVDGELWLGRGRFEAVAAVVRDARPDPQAWAAVQYRWFEAPHAPGPFEARAARLSAWAAACGDPRLQAVPQETLADAAALQRRLAHVVRDGGEGLMLHRADALYRVGRDEVLLKLKPRQDDEATVIGHLPGRGRLQGQLGALRAQHDDGRRFALGTGLRDAERRDPPPLGTRVTYTYQGLTAQGLPRFPCYLRRAVPGTGERS